MVMFSSIFHKYFIVKIMCINEKMTPESKGDELTEKEIYMAFKNVKI